MNRAEPADELDHRLTQLWRRQDFGLGPELQHFAGLVIDRLDGDVDPNPAPLVRRLGPRRGPINGRRQHREALQDFLRNLQARFAAMETRLEVLRPRCPLQRKRSKSSGRVKVFSDTSSVPMVRGGFEDGVGVFIADEIQGGPACYRPLPLVADHPVSARWVQAFSPDDGATWETNWEMDFTRA